jgi:hypothetical protein
MFTTRPTPAPAKLPYGVRRRVPVVVVEFYYLNSDLFRLDLCRDLYNKSLCCHCKQVLRIPFGANVTPA